MSVTEAIESELDALRKRAPDLAAGGLAASALVLAGELDKERNSATSKAMCVRALQDALDRLRELAPPAAENDSLDDLTARRATRLKRSTAA